MRRIVSLVTLVLAVLGVACRGVATRPTDRGSTGLPPQLDAVAVRASGGMVVAGSPEAAEAGAAVLAAGGNAVDAAVTAAFVVAATEIGAAGLGGTAVAMVLQPHGITTVFGVPPIAPFAVDGAAVRHLHDESRPWGYPTVAVPGAVAVLGRLHERHGNLAWKDVVEPAAGWAERGAPVGPLHHAEAEGYRDRIAEQPAAAALLLGDDGAARPVGARAPNPALARTLRRLGDAGADDFYRGALAEVIEQDMIDHGGFLRRSDLGRVRAVEESPVRGRFRGLEVLAAPPPFGGAEVVRALEILDGLPADRVRGPGPDRCHAIVESVRMAFALRGRPARPWPPWLPGDDAPDAPARLARRIRFDRALGDDEISASSPPMAAGGTTHLVVADRQGTVVSMSMSIGVHFGAARINPELGFLYNGFLGWTDTARPDAPPRPTPGRSLTSAMTPVVVRDPHSGWLVALGSAGSDRITSSVIDVVGAMVDRDLALDAAVSEPRVLWGGPSDRRVYLEIALPAADGWADALAARGFPEIYRQRFPAPPADLAAFGGTNALAFEPGTGDWIGVADPRRDGAARAPAGG